MILAQLDVSHADPTNSASPIRNDNRVTSRWDEIRAANAAGTRSSSWDAVRQGRGSSHNSSEPVPHPAIDEPVGRAQEQARFDAMLEAERKLARG